MTMRYQTPCETVVDGNLSCKYIHTQLALHLKKVCMAEKGAQIRAAPIIIRTYNLSYTFVEYTTSQLIYQQPVDISATCLNQLCSCMQMNVALWLCPKT